MDVITSLDQRMITMLTKDKTIPDFSPGDTISIAFRIVEGSRERLQNFEGVCIARRGQDMSASVTVRRISWGEGVERVFPLYSPRLESIKVIRRGRVRRAKLYYLRARSGKSARIAERVFGRGGKRNRRMAASQKLPDKSPSS